MWNLKNIIGQKKNNKQINNVVINEVAFKSAKIKQKLCDSIPRSYFFYFLTHIQLKGEVSRTRIRKYQDLLHVYFFIEYSV